MKEFRITFEEVITDNFIIEAENLKDAMQKAETMYNNNEINLNNGVLVSILLMSEDLETENFEFSHIDF